MCFEISIQASVVSFVGAVKCYATIKRSVFMQPDIRAYSHYYIQVNHLCCFRYMLICVCEVLLWINILGNPNIPFEAPQVLAQQISQHSSSNDVTKFREARHHKRIWSIDVYAVEINNCNSFGCFFFLLLLFFYFFFYFFFFYFLFLFFLLLSLFYFFFFFFFYFLFFFFFFFFFMYCLKPVTHSDILFRIIYLIPVYTLAKAVRLRSIHIICA